MFQGFALIVTEGLLCAQSYSRWAFSIEESRCLVSCKGLPFIVAEMLVKCLSSPILVELRVVLNDVCVMRAILQNAGNSKADVQNRRENSSTPI